MFWSNKNEKIFLLKAPFLWAHTVLYQVWYIEAEPFIPEHRNDVTASNISLNHARTLMKNSFCKITYTGHSVRIMDNPRNTQLSLAGFCFIIYKYPLGNFSYTAQWLYFRKGHKAFVALLTILLASLNLKMKEVQSCNYHMGTFLKSPLPLPTPELA